MPNIPPVTTAGLDDINRRRRHREVTDLMLNFQHDDSRIRTDAEVAADQTPINYAFPPGYVQRAGATRGDNVTDDTAAFQRALDALPANGELIIPDYGGTYLIAGNLTVTGRKSIRGIGFPKIRHTGSGHCFELTGGSGSTNQMIANMDIEGTSSGQSGVYANAANNGPHSLDNVWIHDYTGVNAACFRLDDAYSWLVMRCWFRDSSIGIFGESGGVNEILTVRNHFTDCDVAMEILRGNHWTSFKDFIAGPTTSAIGFRIGLNNTTGEPVTDFEALGTEFEGSFDYCFDIGPGATNVCRGIAIIRPEFDVTDGNLGSHYIRGQNTTGFQLEMMGRVGNLTGSKKWYSLASTVSNALIMDMAYNSAQSTISAANYRLITQDRIDGTTQEIVNPILSQRVILSTTLSPAQITANQNNYNPTGLGAAGVLRLNSDAARDITGIVPSANHQALLVLNVGGFPITLRHESGSSTAANRFTFASGTDLVLNRTGMLWLFYDQTTARWFGSLAT